MTMICIALLIVLISIPVGSSIIDHIRTKQQESLESNNKVPTIKIPEQAFGATILQHLAYEETKQKIKDLTNKKEIGQ